MMKKKIGVLFRKSEKTAYAFQRLRCCKHCGSYSVLWHEVCAGCGRENSLVPIQQMARTASRRSFQIQWLGLGILVCLGILGASTLRELAAAIVGGPLLLLVFTLMQKKFAPYEQKAHFLQYIAKERSAIKESLHRELGDVTADVKADDLKSAYEKIREIGYFLSSDSVKIRKIMFLNHFILRKDMDLELDTLIPSVFDRDFVNYLHEIARLKRSLIKQTALDYVVRYETEILRQENGAELIGQVLGAALRMKSYVLRYQGIIARYLEHLPKERLLRLAKLLHAHPQEDWAALSEATRRLIGERYSFDPDFKGVL